MFSFLSVPLRATWWLFGHSLNLAIYAWISGNFRKWRRYSNLGSPLETPLTNRETMLQRSYIVCLLFSFFLFFLEQKNQLEWLIGYRTFKMKLKISMDGDIRGKIDEFSNWWIFYMDFECWHEWINQEMFCSQSTLFSTKHTQTNPTQRRISTTNNLPKHQTLKEPQRHQPECDSTFWMEIPGSRISYLDFWPQNHVFTYEFSSERP